MKNLIRLSMLAILATGGCKDKGDPKPAPRTPHEPGPATVAAPMPPPKASTAEDLARRYDQCWRLFNEHKWDDFGGCFDEHVVSTTQGVPGQQDRAAQVAGGKVFADAFPDGKGETRFTLVNGRRVMGVTMFTGTHTGTLKDPTGDLPATGKPIGHLVALDVAFGDHDQITRMHETWDMGSFMFQLGLSPGPGRAAGSQVAPTGTVIARGDDTEQRNVATHRRAYELFNARDKAFDDLIADDVVESGNGDPADVKGKAELVAKNAMMVKAFTDLKVTPDEVWGAGDYTVVRAHLRGTNDVEVKDMGLPRTGKAFDLGMLELIRWENGKAKQVWVFMNTMEMAQQLGLMGDPGQKPGPT